MNKALFLNSGSSYLIKIVNQGVKGFLGIYIINLLSIEDYGAYTFLLSISVFFYLFSTFGIRSALRRFLPIFMTRTNPIIYFLKIFPLILFTSLLLGASFLLFVDLFPNLFHVKELPKLFTLFLGVIVIQVQIQIIEIIYKSFMLHRFIHLFLMTVSVAKLVTFMVFLNEKLSLEILIYLDFLFLLMYLIPSLVFLINRGKPNRHYAKLEERVLKSRQFRRFSLWSFLQEAGGSIFEVTMDVLIISLFLGATEVAEYGVAVKISSLVFMMIPTVALHDVINPIVFRICSGGRDDILSKIFSLMNKVSIMTALPILILLMFFGRGIIQEVFNGKYDSSFLLLMTVCVFQFLNLFQYSLSTIINALKLPKHFAVTRLFAILNLILNLILIRYCGIIGIALGTGISILLANIYLYRVSKKSISINVDMYIVIWTSIISVLLAVITWNICTLTESLLMPVLIYMAMVFSCFYLLVKFTNILVNDQDRSTLNALIRAA